MSYNAQIETREIADDALDGVAGGVAALAVHGSPAELHAVGGADIAGHGVAGSGSLCLESGTANLNIAAV